MESLRQTISNSTDADYQFMLANFTKDDLVKNYEDMLTINHNLNFKNDDLVYQNKLLEEKIKQLELSLLTLK